MNARARRSLLSLAAVLACAGAVRADEQWDLVYHSGVCGDLDKVKAALPKSKVDRAPHGDGDTALLKAAEKGCVETARFLLDNRADVNQRHSPQKFYDNYGKDGRTPLIYAAQNKDLAMLQLLVERKANLGLASDGDETALHWAAYKDWKEGAAYLLEHGAPADHSTSKTGSPLSYSAGTGDVELIKMIAEKLPPGRMNAEM